MVITRAMSRHTHRSLPVVAAALATAAAVAACGGSSLRSTTGDTTTSSPSQHPPGRIAFRFSACMRAHGLSNFPDPNVQQNGNQVSATIHLTPSMKGSPAARSAFRACARILGPRADAHPVSPADRRKQMQAALAFARCMRDHGFPNFPDPTAQGQLSPEMVTAAGINLHQPAVLHAGLACVPVTHGLLTRADIQRAVNGTADDQQ